jgi:regulator of sirC expression with transglutaminase-like and TPR domain
LILAQKQHFDQSAALLKTYLNAMPNAPDAEIVRKQLREIERQGLTPY